MMDGLRQCLVIQKQFRSSFIARITDISLFPKEEHTLFRFLDLLMEKTVCDQSPLTLVRLATGSRYRGEWLSHSFSIRMLQSN